MECRRPDPPHALAGADARGRRGVPEVGYRAFTAANAIQGLREVRERRPHVTLLHLAMPGPDGHAVFDHLISSSTPSSIVILSGSNDEVAARALLQRGAFDYVPKPVNLAHLRTPTPLPSNRFRSSSPITRRSGTEPPGV